MAGTALSTFDHLLTELVRSLPAHRVLDVGAGAGKNAGACLLANPQVRLMGLEPYAPSHVECQDYYRQAYREGVLCQTATEFFAGSPDELFDVVVFGDVLEHMWHGEALNCIHAALHRSKRVFAVWPTRYLQGSLAGNDLEAHRCELQLSDFANLPVETFMRRYDGPHLMNMVVLTGYR